MMTEKENQAVADDAGGKPLSDETVVAAAAATDTNDEVTSAAAATASVTDDENNNNDDDNNNTTKKNKEKKNPPPGLVIPPKKPKLTKAERRALQEQQRAAKAARGGGNNKQLKPTPKKHVVLHQQEQQKLGSGGGGRDGSNDGGSNSKSHQSSNNNNNNKNSGTTSPNANNNNNACLDLFSHLSPYQQMPDPYAPEFTETLHPDVIELGLKYASGEVQGDNERCRAMMKVFLQVLEDYVPPSTSKTSSLSKITAAAATTTTSPIINNDVYSSNNINNDSSKKIDFRHHFDHQVLKPSFQFWTVNCRPHSVSMGNAFTFLKTAVGSLDRDADIENDDSWKRDLKDTVERYIQERLEYADRAIAQHALSKIHDGDVLLTFGRSEAIEVLLKTAHCEQQIQFYVWIVGGNGSQQMLKSLRDVGIAVGYIQMNALTYVLEQQGVTKVFLGASALLTNGSIYGQIGTACIALLAKNHNVPVLVCSETYKISNKVQLESITHNELGDPNDLLPTTTLNYRKSDATDDNNKKSKSKLPYVAANILYDVTPDKFVSGIITELGIIPPTSVAVLLREMNSATTTNQ